MKKLILLLSFILILITSINVVIAISEETFTVDLVSGKDAGFLFGEKHIITTPCTEEEKSITFTLNNGTIDSLCDEAGLRHSPMQNQLGFYGVNITSEKAEFSLYLIDYLGNETYFEKKYSIERGQKIMVDNPLIDLKEIEVISIKLDEYCTDKECVSLPFAKLKFSEKVNDMESTKKITECIENTCYLARGDILSVVLSSNRKKQYSLSIDNTYPEDGAVELEINHETTKGLYKGNSYNLDPFPINIFIEDVFDNYIVLEVNELESYSISTQKNVLERFFAWFKRLFG